MVSVSPLSDIKVWLEKPRYDAAEQKFYENLAKSSKKVVTNTKSPELAKLNNVANDTGLDQEPEMENILESNVSFDSGSRSNLKSNLKNHKTKDIEKTNKESVSDNFLNKKDSAKLIENASPKPKVDGMFCTVPVAKEACNKHDKVKKSDSHHKDNNTCASNKFKSNNTAKVADEKLMKRDSGHDKGNHNIETISEVVKLKGFYLQSKSLSIQPDSLQNKGTNVNTIPELSKITPSFDRPKNCPNIIKKTQIQNPYPDKRSSVELILPPDNINDPQIEDPAKKDSKKKKKHKKERQKDKKGVSQNNNSWNSLAGEVAKARQHIKNSLQCIDDIAATSNTVSVEVTNRLNSLEKENSDLKNQVSELGQLLKKMELRVSSIEKISVDNKPSVSKVSEAASAPKKDDAEDDDGVDLFGSDSEDEDAEAAKIKEQRLAEYAARKAKKPVLIAKSNIILDVKPWDDETDMKDLETEVRKITTDGLVWGASKLVPLAYGIHKLQISCVVEDDKVSVDWLQETIQEIEDYVQSVDIAAFNKV